MPRRRPWTEARTARALENFLSDRDVWPSWSEFRRAGPTGLRNAVDRHGGAQRWADDLGVAYEPRSGPPGWTENRVRQELRALLTDRASWPTQREFRSAGKERLFVALRRFGGRRRWALEFGIPFRGRSPWTERDS